LEKLGAQKLGSKEACEKGRRKKETAMGESKKGA